MVMSNMDNLLDAIDVIGNFLRSCECVSTSTIITPDGERLITDWGYFEEGLNEIAQYAYGKIVEGKNEN